MGSCLCCMGLDIICIALWETVYVVWFGHYSRSVALWVIVYGVWTLASSARCIELLVTVYEVWVSTLAQKYRIMGSPTKWYGG